MVPKFKNYTGPQEYSKTTSKDKITYFKCWKENMCENAINLGRSVEWTGLGIINFEGEFLFFLNFSCMFLNPNNFFQLNSNYSNLIDMRYLQEQVKKALCYQNNVLTYHCQNKLFQ